MAVALRAVSRHCGPMIPLPTRPATKPATAPSSELTKPTVIFQRLSRFSTAGTAVTTGVLNSRRQAGTDSKYRSACQNNCSVSRTDSGVVAEALMVVAPRRLRLSMTSPPLGVVID